MGKRLWVYLVVAGVGLLVNAKLVELAAVREAATAARGAATDQLIQHFDAGLTKLRRM